MTRLARFFPPRCLLCGDAGARGLALCDGCNADLPRIERACTRCGEPLPVTGAGLPALTVCGACLWHPPPFTAIHVPFHYANPIDWLVHRLKFRGDLAAGRLLGGLLALELAPRLATAGIDRLVPMPLHRGRLGERGFNQALEIARPLARRLDLPCAHAALRRVRRTPPQMDLPARRRRANVRGAFVTGRVAGHALLVDDVVTTAATVREAAHVMARRGGALVTVAAVARA